MLPNERGSCGAGSPGTVKICAENGQSVANMMCETGATSRTDIIAEGAGESAVS